MKHISGIKGKTQASIIHVYSHSKQDKTVFGTRIVLSSFTWGNQQGDNQAADNRQPVGNQSEDNLGPGPEAEGSRRVDHMPAEAHILRGAELADLGATFAGPEAPPSPVVAQTSHLSCPSRPCVVSACMHRPSSRQRQTSSSVFGMLLIALHFQQSSRQSRKYMRVVAGKT